MDQKSVLIIDDDPIYIRVTEEFLTEHGFNVSFADKGANALNSLNKKKYSVVLLDLNLPDMSGIEILKQIQNQLDDTIVILITALPSISSAVEAIKLGARNYISKPCDNEELLFKINKELELSDAKNEIQQLKFQVEDRFQFGNMIGKHPSIEKMFHTLRHLHDSNATILLTGETGTGKSMLAKMIHFNSSRKKCRFLVIHPGSLAEDILESELFGHKKGAFTGAFNDKSGIFERASDGTVFIDEIGDMSQKMQMKFLRILQEKDFEPVGGTETIKTNARIIAATNKNLKQLVQEGKFREDLYYRINVLTFEIPSLRDRSSDILPLVNHFINYYCKKNNFPPKKISPAIINGFQSYSWPGNIRELEHLIERMVLLAPGIELTEDLLPEEIIKNKHFGLCPELLNDEKSSDMEASDKTFDDFIKTQTEQLEFKYFKSLLEKYNGVINRVSEASGLNRKTVYRKLLKLNLDKKDSKNTSF